MRSYAVASTKLACIANHSWTNVSNVSKTYVARSAWGESTGNGTPARVASSHSVSGLTVPSRCRCSSVLGMRNRMSSSPKLGPARVMRRPYGTRLSSLSRMQMNSLKQKLAAGRAVSVIAPFASSAGLVELLGHLEFDGVFIDCEHGPSGWEDVENMVRAAEVAGYSSVVRVDRNDAATITRAVDRGDGGGHGPH